MKISLIPVFSMYSQAASQDVFPRMLHFMHEQGGELDLHLAFRSPMVLIESLPEATMEQLQPFLDSGRVNIFPDSYKATFDGLMEIKELEKQLSAAKKSFSKIFEKKPSIFIPRWPDVFRPEASKAYNSAWGQMLVSGYTGKDFRPYFFHYDRRKFIPSLSIVSEGMVHKNAWSRVNSQVRRCTREVHKLIGAGVIEEPEELQILLFFPSDGNEEQTSHAIEILSHLGGGRQNFASGSEGLKLLAVQNYDVEKPRRVSKSLDILKAGFFPCQLDPPNLAPNFIAQLISSGKTKAEYSSFLLDFEPDQRVEEPRPKREVTYNMQGQAHIAEDDFQLLFENGNLSRIQNGKGFIELGRGIASRMICANGGKPHSVSFAVESAFAIEAERSRGLRQTLQLNIPQSQISGRITNDFLQIEDLDHIYIDSYIQHPWMKDNQEIKRYIPQMISLWSKLDAQTSIRIKSMNSDGSSRSMEFALARHEGEFGILIPGCSWILEANGVSLGLELIFGSRFHINLPSTLFITKDSKESYSISFSATGEYISPRLDMLNGLLEHYSLRLIPNVSDFNEFPSIKKSVWDQLHDPFVIYY